jgi:signal transduction histidine kinase
LGPALRRPTYGRRTRPAGIVRAYPHPEVARIRAGSDRLLRLIEGILAFARLETGGDRPRFDRVQVRSLLEHAADMIRPTAAEKGIDFQLRIEDVPEAIRTDPERVVQILLSLLTNAVKFTELGVVEMVAARDDGMLNIDVRDSGRGIATEHLPHIFNPFWQAEQPATRTTGGAGIGLSVARRVARLLNGDVLVAETSTRGTTFRLQLPL